MTEQSPAEQLFFAALAVPPADRAAYLDAHCPNTAVRARVEKLLAAQPKVGGFLADGPAAATGTFGVGDPAEAATADFPGRDEHLGAVLAGKYRLIEAIGEGGMGSVFLAQQTEPVKRAVAVKVIKAGMDSKAVLARFEAERQALALMDHPNIARVLDAGTTDGGRPFFVMELVKGVPITEYCDAHRLTPRQRLELFVPVCQAIQHAHQKGVIHRDIKPSNVLVALYDDRPVPKVIDFGVAKAAGQTLTDKTLMTGFGAVVGTPEYMSPEQASLNNLDVDTRSDVYSLGVLLYELLTGSTPVDRKALGQAALLEVLRVVREVEAPKPSHKLSTSAALPSVAASRGTEPAKLSKLMRGELDWLVLKALEKDRARRYDTANGLARDIQRYLADEVVEARPPTAGYRLRKAVRRHKGQVLAASLVLLALLAGIAGTTLGLVRANAARREAVAAQAAEAERAEGERAATELTAARLKQIEAINDTVFDIFAGFDINKVKEGQEPVEYVLARKLIAAGQKLDAGAIHDPLVLAYLQNRLGQTLINLGEAAAAAELLAASLEARTARLGRDHPDTLDSMGRLATAYHRSGKLDLALPLYEERLKLSQAKFGPDHPDTLSSMGYLAAGYKSVGRLDRAVPLLEEALNVQKANHSPDHPHTLTWMSDLATCYWHAGRLDRAVPLHEETLNLLRAKRGPDNPATLTSLHNLAEGYKQAGRLDKALPMLEEALRLQKAKLGPDHPDTLTSMINLASAYKEAGKMDLALPLAEEERRLSESKLGPDHPQTLVSMGNLAVCYLKAGKIEKGMHLCEEALRLQKAKLGPDHPDTLTGMHNLASAYIAAGKLDLALPLQEEAWRLKKAKLGPDHPSTLTSMDSMATAYRAAGKFDRSLSLAEEVWRLMKDKLGPDHPDTLVSLNNLACGYKDASKFDRAVPLLEEAVGLMRAKLGPDHPDTLTGMSNLALAYHAAGELDLALPLSEEALRLKKAKLGPDHPNTLVSLNNLAQDYKAAGKLDQAVPVFEEAVKLMKAKLGPDHPNTLVAMSNLALSYQAVRKIDLALPLFEEVSRLRTAKLGPRHPDTFASRRNLASGYAAGGRPAQALPLSEETLRLMRAELGPEHPDTIGSMNELAIYHHLLKQFDRSIPLFEEVLRLREKTLGRAHPTTLLAVANLGKCYQDAGHLGEAIPLLEEAFLAAKTRPDLGWVGPKLLDAYAAAGRPADAARLVGELLAGERKTLPKDSPQLAGRLAEFSRMLLEMRVFAEVEPLLRECLAIREAKEPDDWRTFNARSMLGGSLLGQGKHADAEPLLLAGYEGMKAREKVIPPQGGTRIPEALDRLVELATATGKPDEAKRWRAERAKYPFVAPMPRPVK